MTDKECRSCGIEVDEDGFAPEGASTEWCPQASLCECLACIACDGSC